MRSAIQEVTGVRLAQYVMGTVVEITAYPVCGEEHARKAAARALREFERVERAFSRFDPLSELSRLNNEAAKRPVSVSDEFFALTARGLQYSRHTGGGFSIALQPLVRLWESAGRVGRLPTGRQVDSALQICDPNGVILDAERRTVRFAAPGFGLNFDGLAKGYATDRARSILAEYGFSRAVVNAGSSSIAILHPVGGTFAIRHPERSGCPVASLLLDRPALSTSGTGERGFNIGGRWYSHVIDPSSGFPVERLASATAVGEHAELMEVASKLLLLRGCERGLGICESLGWTAGGVTVTVEGRELSIRHPDDVSIVIEPEYDTHSTCTR